MHEDIGLNFAAALRAFLRQDPDIIMVGEIRDFETAEIGVKAALTGHLVLSTLHTNDAPSTINRLLNMGVEPFLVASSVNLILAQRLARVICPQCKEDRPRRRRRSSTDMGWTGPPFVPQHGVGCPHCGGTGYKGRVALYEVMPMTDELRELVLAGASATEVKRTAIQARHDDAPPERPQQDRRGRDDDRGGPPRHLRPQRDRSRTVEAAPLTPALALRGKEGSAAGRAGTRPRNGRPPTNRRPRARGATARDVAAGGGAPAHVASRARARYRVRQAQPGRRAARERGPRPGPRARIR